MTEPRFNHYDAYGYWLADPAPELDIHLLRQTVKWVEYEDERDKAGESSEWNQHEWGVRLREKTGAVCGTACCVAGHVVLETGGSMVFHGNENATTECKDAEGNMHLISEYAQEKLGLTPHEAAIMFRGGNSAQGIRNQATRIALHRGYEL